jgi:hypothetical protein
MEITSTCGSRRVTNTTDISFDGYIDAWNIRFEWYGASLQLPPGFEGRDKRKRHYYEPAEFPAFVSLPLADYLSSIKYGIVWFEGYAVLIDPDLIQITHVASDAEWIRVWYSEWMGNGMW